MLVRVLGPLRVESDDGATIAVTRPMERRLLAALALRKPDAVTADVLADALWLDEPPKSAHKTIQTNVLRLRDRLGRSTILTTEHGYRLADDVIVDVDRFESTVAAAGEWDDALALWRGVPFDDLLGWPPADARRARLEELHRSAHDNRLDAVLAAGDANDALVAELEALVSADPLREKRWVLLVDALQQTGRRPEALRTVERARQVFVAELGIGLGPELNARYEALLIDEGSTGGASARGGDALSLADRHLADAAAARARGDVREAVAASCRAGELARMAGDPRRLALAALSAAGEGWTTGLDAADAVVSLLSDAVAIVPAGPTPLRSKLLARLAIAHSGSPQDAEAHARSALTIARTLEEPELEAGALHALAIVVEDPMRLADQRAWIDRLLRLADAQPHQPWRRWALPLKARLVSREGDTSTAFTLLDELAQDAEAAGDAVGVYAAAHHDVLSASIAGDWPLARQAVVTVRVLAEAAQYDPMSARIQEMGLAGIIDLYEGKPLPEMPAGLEWPRPSMGFAVQAWYADGLARQGDLERAAKALTEIVPTDLFDLDRDSYWLPTLGFLADAAHRAASPVIADVVADLVEPVIAQTIIDNGCLYRGSVAHAAGLAAATCNRPARARELLSEAAAIHDRQGSPWMTDASTAALGWLD